MFVIGCLLLVILPIAGLALGGVVAGRQGAEWGALAGLAIAMLVCGFTIYGLAVVSRRK